MPDADAAALRETAQRLFDELRRRTHVPGGGVRRPSYGAGEAAAHALMAETAATLGMAVERDAALNLYMRLPGRDRGAPVTMMGSHLDSVPEGGNYDGAAGVVAGLAVAAALRARGVTPRADLVVMGIRAEEAAWFDASYIGSHAAFGRLAPEILAVRRSDDGVSLAEHLRREGGDPEAVAAGKAHLDPARIGAFLELHIEQGPVLVEAAAPVGIVTGIRGCRRFRHARCHGAYAHSGAEPRATRSDAVAATVELVAALERRWLEVEAAGRDLVFTVGELTTDPARHGPSKVAGETRFVLDFRSIDVATMEEMRRAALDLSAGIGARRRVRFDLGEPIWSAPALLDPSLRQRLAGFAAARGLSAPALASGAGHDASVFANLGVPSAMVFIRNCNGSHNPAEAMELDDFCAGAGLLLDLVASEAA